MKKYRVYISGGITNVHDYMTSFRKAEKRLESEGYTSIVNPAFVNCHLPIDFSHEDYMKVSIAMLGCCDAIYMLKGWEKSEGAKEEYIYASKLGLQILKE